MADPRDVIDRDTRQPDRAHELRLQALAMLRGLAEENEEPPPPPVSGWSVKKPDY